MSGRQWLVIAILLPAVAIGSVLVGRALRDDGTPTTGIQLADAGDAAIFEHEYYIPLGTAGRIDAGEQVEIVPRELEVRVGEAIRIVNDDVEGHVVGVFFVGAGETLSQRFTAPGVLAGECSVHSGGEFTLRVQA